MGFVLPDIQTENRLLAQANQGDRAAVMRIYDLYFTPIYEFIRLRVDDQSLAEDLTSEVFVKLIDTLGTRSAPRISLRGWLFQVARSQLQRHYGRAKHFSSAALEDLLAMPAEDDLELQFIRALSAEQAQRALRMLAPDQLEVLVLRFGQGLSLQETADIMGKKTGAIKSLQFRAVNTLRQILGEMRKGDND